MSELLQPYTESIADNVSKQVHTTARRNNIPVHPTVLTTLGHLYEYERLHIDEVRTFLAALETPKQKRQNRPLYSHAEAVAMLEQSSDVFFGNRKGPDANPAIALAIIMGIKKIGKIVHVEYDSPEQAIARSIQNRRVTETRLTDAHRQVSEQTQAGTLTADHLGRLGDVYKQDLLSRSEHIHRTGAIVFFNKVRIPLPPRSVV